MTNPPIASFDGVGFTASRTRILQGIDLIIEPGDVLGISGPNGSGKTTLLRLLATLLRPTSGTWSTLGADDRSDRDEIIGARRKISMVGHSPALWPELTLRENVDIIDGLSPPDNPEDVLAMVGLSRSADRQAERSSLGMQRRVELARVLRRVPRLLLLDEAHAGLDSPAATIVDEVVRRVSKRGGAVVMVSHELTRIDALTNRQARIEGGAVVEEVS